MDPPKHCKAPDPRARSFESAATPPFKWAKRRTLAEEEQVSDGRRKKCRSEVKAHSSSVCLYPKSHTSPFFLLHSYPHESHSRDGGLSTANAINRARALVHERQKQHSITYDTSVFA